MFFFFFLIIYIIRSPELHWKSQLHQFNKKHKNLNVNYFNFIFILFNLFILCNKFLELDILFLTLKQGLFILQNRLFIEF